MGAGLFTGGLLGGVARGILLKAEKEHQDYLEKSQSKRDLLGYLIKAGEAGLIPEDKYATVMGTTFDALTAMTQEGPKSGKVGVLGKLKGKKGEPLTSDVILKQLSGLLGPMGGGAQKPDVSARVAPPSDPGAPAPANIPFGVRAPVPTRPDFQTTVRPPTSTQQP